ncbi:MAG: ABC transporter permease [bacterium]|nr:ABC transporter permease [bacterium]
MKKTLRGIYLALILIFLYAPIAVMIVLSFNASKSRAKWGGFTFDWYVRLTQRSDILQALWVTVSVAVVATIIATILGTAAAIGIHAMKKRPAAVLMKVSYLPMTAPDIVTGVSLMLMFVFVNIPMGYWTMVMAHVAFDTPYVLFAVLPKLRQMDVNTYEAALDLGCTPMQAVQKVILPEITPGVITGALLSFTMSLDDFVISYFTSYTDQNLSMVIYSAARKGIEPSIYALSTLMFIAVLVLLLIVNKRSSLEDVS